MSKQFPLFLDGEVDPASAKGSSSAQKHSQVSTYTLAGLEL